MLMSEQTGMPVHVAENPLDCVVDGTGKRLEMNLPFAAFNFRRSSSTRR